MGTAPKVKQQTQPTNVMYSALFEGDTTRQLLEDNIFPCLAFWFFNFFGLFQIFKILKKNKIAL